jgi:HlyD family secretion protein
MVCVAEVHEADIAKIQLGSPVTLQSAALPKTLNGKVSRVDRVVGPPQMRSPNPLARSDFRSIPVWIAIDTADVPHAANRINLQVEVAISPGQSNNAQPSSN